MPGTRTLVIILVVLVAALAYLVALSTHLGGDQWTGTWRGPSMFEGDMETVTIEKTGQDWVIFGDDTWTVTSAPDAHLGFAPSEFIERDGRLVTLTQYTREPVDGWWYEREGDALVQYSVDEDGEKTWTFERQ